MSRHKPIRFEEANISALMKQRLQVFVKAHPLASNATKAVLALAAIGGILTLSLITPGVTGMMGKLLASERRARRERYQRLWQSFYRLRQERILEYKGEKNGERLYQLTKNGEKKLRGFLAETMEIKVPSRWDGRWRVIIFDVPERYRAARQSLRRKLGELGCYQLQKSVWVHPFSCEEEIEFLKEIFEVKPYVHVLLVSEMPAGKVLYHFREIIRRAI